MVKRCETVFYYETFRLFSLTSISILFNFFEVQTHFAKSEKKYAKGEVTVVRRKALKFSTLPNFVQASFFEIINHFIS